MKYEWLAWIASGMGWVVHGNIFLRKHPQSTKTEEREKSKLKEGRAPYIKEKLLPIACRRQ